MRRLVTFLIALCCLLSLSGFVPAQAQGEQPTATPTETPFLPIPTEFVPSPVPTEITPVPTDAAISTVESSPVPAADAAAPGEQTYTVQQGDNLFRIGLKFNVPTNVLAAYNGIINPNLIFVGQVLRIPPGGGVIPTATPGTGATATPRPPTTTPQPGSGTYTVQRGDTLTRIASRFGTTVQAIIQLNGIVNPNLIFVGQVLKIPGGGVIITSTPGGPTATPIATVTIGPSPTALPTLTGALEIGGQVFGLSDTTKSALQTARMTWIKRQAIVGINDPATLINEAKGAGYKILLSVVGDKNQVLNPGYFDTYADYVRTAATAGADAIEVWNEQNIDREWPAGQIDAAKYVQLLRQAYTAIKAANPNVIVISGAPAPTGFFGGNGKGTGGWNDDVYYAGMAAAGAANYADCIGIHYNEGIVSPQQNAGDPRGNYPTRYYSRMLDRALARFPGKRGCFTEIGYLSREGYGELPPAFGWAGNTTVTQQAAWIAQAAQLAKNGGRVRLFIVFNIDSTTYDGGDPQAGYALIRPDGACPGCVTLGAVP
jgi:LysM repeat protein